MVTFNILSWEHKFLRNGSKHVQSIWAQLPLSLFFCTDEGGEVEAFASSQCSHCCISRRPRESPALFKVLGSVYAYGWQTHILFTELWTGREIRDDLFPPRHVPCRNLKPRAHFSAPCRFPLSHLPCSVDSMFGVHSGRVWTRETLFSDSHISVSLCVCWLCPMPRDPIQSVQMEPRYLQFQQWLWWNHWDCEASHPWLVWRKAELHNVETVTVLKRDFMQSEHTFPNKS